MTRAHDAWRGQWLRGVLLALAVSALWLAISLFSSTSSAAADEAEPASLLGTVGAVVEPVLEPVTAIVEPVTAIVEPVVEVVPAPVGDLVESVVPGTVGELAKPVVDTVDQVAASLPIVGGIVGDDTVGGIVSPVTSVVDDTLSAIVGSPIELPGGDSDSSPGLPGDSTHPDAGVDTGIGPAVIAASDAVTADSVNAADASGANDPGAGVTTSSGTSAPTQPGAPPGDGPPALVPPGGGSAGAGSGASGAGSGGASASSDVAYSALELDALASLVLHSVDDALPSSPVYDTDSTPD